MRQATLQCLCATSVAQQSVMRCRYIIAGMHGAVALFYMYIYHKCRQAARFMQCVGLLDLLTAAWHMQYGFAFICQTF